MKLLSKPLFPLILFVLLHVFLININAAEWGDTYRILRGSEHIKELTYPEDEKRPPLFSALLATRPFTTDPIFYGRIVMFTLSICFFFIFSKLLDFFYSTQATISEEKTLALYLFALNPVLLYWSLRIYADVLFALFVLLNILLITKWKDSLATFQPKRVILLAVISVLAVYTRFEGYLLFGSMGFGLIFLSSLEGNIFTKTFSNLKNILVYVFSFCVLLVPYYIWRNPLTSSYFDETSNRAYDLNTLLIYILSLGFAFGFIFALFFLLTNRISNLKFLKTNPAITMFLISDLVLVLFWPAAIPRLFIPIIPLTIILLSSSIVNYFLVKAKSTKEVGEVKDPTSSTTVDFKLSSLYKIIRSNINLVLSLGFLFTLYVTGQYLYKLQFLVVQLEFFILILILNLILFVTLLFRWRDFFYITLLLSLFVWSFATIYVHKDIHKGIVQVTDLVSKEFCGKIAYNDVSSVSDWYLNTSPHALCTEGYYYDITEEKSLKKEKLIDKGTDYVLVTNEHNTDMEIDFDDTPYIVELFNVQYEINGKLFFTNFYKFEKDL